MVFIGIDQSTTNTGIVVIDEEQEIIEFELVKDKTKDIIDRSLIMIEKVKSKIGQYKPDDCKVCVEGISFFSKGRIDKLAMLLGGIFYGLKAEGYEVGLVPPNSLKQSFTGSGKAKKEDMLASCPKEILDLFREKEKKIDDLVDAYALACYCKSAAM